MPSKLFLFILQTSFLDATVFLDNWMASCVIDQLFKHETSSSNIAPTLSAENDFYSPDIWFRDMLEKAFQRRYTQPRGLLNVD